MQIDTAHRSKAEDVLFMFMLTGNHRYTQFCVSVITGVFTIVIRGNTLTVT